jgi:hypothetical protein
VHGAAGAAEQPPVQADEPPQTALTPDAKELFHVPKTWLLLGFFQRLGSHAAPPRSGYEPSMFTARAATSSTVTAESADSRPIIALARRDNGIVSVGLNAIAFVKETYM